MTAKFHRNRKGQGTVEWLLIIALIALIAQAATRRTGSQVEMLFKASADAIGVEFRSEAASEVVSVAEESGGIAASGRSARDRVTAKARPRELALVEEGR
ncbi:MAG: hypothetical protein HY814_06875 [Candidatus Riflebacteria bacterium]|nr:hypothetical protein [Candidatus Riflebacteria bacterium]